jgi:hypothetical protein
MLLLGDRSRAFPGQDHRAHITSHLNFMATNMARNNPTGYGFVREKLF